MKNDVYHIRVYDHVYREQTLNLLGKLWAPSQEINTAYLDWKYFSNPYNSRPMIFLIYYQDQIVGVRSLCASLWQVSGCQRHFYCLSDADTYIVPDHRRKGLLLKSSLAALDAIADDKYELIITTSGNQFSSAGVIKIGWLNVGLLNDMVWLPRGEYKKKENLRGVVIQFPLLQAIKERIKAMVNQPQLSTSLKAPFYTLDSAFEKEPYPSIELDKKPRINEMAYLVADTSTENLIQHVRDEKFFAWRYENPMGVYRFLFYEKNGMAGYLVLHANVLSFDNRATIVDWQVERIDIFKDLVKAVLEKGGFEQLTIWSSTLSAEHQDLLLELGFQFKHSDRPTGSQSFCPILLVKLVGPKASQNDWHIDGQNLLDIGNWDLRAVYSDVY